MTFPRNWIAIGVSVGALLLVVAGCGHQTGQVGDEPTTSEAELPPWDENSKVGAMSAGLPLGLAIGQPGDGGTSALQTSATARETRRQEAIAQCMIDQGWEYTAWVTDDSSSAASPAYLELTRRQFAERYGFGISTMLDDGPAVMATASEAQDDPNARYVRSLSPSERAAYNETLYGGSSEGSADHSCQAQADEMLASTPGSGSDLAFIDSFEQDLNDLRRRIEADPRVLSAHASYASCMSGKGYPGFANRMAVVESVYEKLGKAQSGGAEMPGVVTTMGSGTEGSSATTGPTADAPGLSDVRTYELAVAGADLACATDDIRVTYGVALELEEDFIEQNKADVTRYRSLIGER